MTQKPLIGITAGEVHNRKYPWMSTVYGQGHAYSDAVGRAGGLPVIMPLIADRTVLRELYDRCDGIVIAGGNDVDPTLYGQRPHPATGDISRRRDDQERQLIDWALADDKPLLGICRGMQLLNVQLGGTLHQHIPDALPDAQDHEISRQHENTAQLAHRLRLDPASQLALMLGTPAIMANSQHHQAVAAVGRGLVASAWAEDEVIEAIELPGKAFVVAVQSHPEGLEAEAETRWRRLFRSFVRAAKAAAKG